MEGKSNILEKIFAVEGNRCSGKPVKNFRGTACVCVWIFNRRCHVNSITFNRIPRMPVWLIGRALIEYKISSGKYRAFSITGHGRASIRHTIRGAPLPSNSLTNFVNYARL